MTMQNAAAMPNAPRATGPLAGVRVVDMTSVGMGPYATQILADMGAEVIKVEAPAGDVFRHAEPALHPGMGATFLNLNRNKQFLVLDVKRAQDLARLKDLIAGADVFISNVRPQSLRKLGLDYESLRASNPRLIYCGAYGYSETGPYAGMPASTTSSRRAAAWRSSRGEQRRRPAVRQHHPGRQGGRADGGLCHSDGPVRARASGQGQAIEVPMFETLVSFLAAEQLAGHTFVPEQGSCGYPRVMSPHRKPYRTLDGHIALLPYTTPQWARFFALSGHAELAEDPRYLDPAARSAHINELYATLADIVSRKTTAEWLALLADAISRTARCRP